MAQREAERPRPSRPPPPTRTADDRITNIRNLHDESFLYIQQGLACDEFGQREQAIALYTKGLDSIAKAIEIAQAAQNCPGPEWENARTMVRKMEKSQSEIKSRVEHILETDSDTARAIQDPPPSYETATTPSSEVDDMSWADNIMNEDISDGRRGSLNGVDGTELYVIPEGVQIFYITPEGFVSAPSYPSSLGVYRLSEEQNRGASNMETPPAFLRVGDWTYPLLPGTSPMLRSDLGAYIFPDTSSSVQGSAVGVIIPNSTSDGERAILEDIFANYTASHTEQEVLEALKNLPALPHGELRPETRVEQEMEVEEVTPRREEDDRTSTKISKGIVTAAEWIAWGLGKGAEKTGVLLKKGSTALREQIKPNEEQTKVDPTTQKGIYYARQATSGAVKVSYFIVDGLGKATMALGRQLAPHVQKQGEKILPESMKGEGGKSKMEDVMEVAAGSLHGFGTVYMALESAAKSLAKSLADETVSVVQHRYGKDVGTATENALYATGNLGLTVNNARNLGIKAVAKRAAKDTGKAVVEDYNKKMKVKEGVAAVGEKKEPPGGSRQPPSGGAGPSGAGLYPTQQLPPQPQ